MGNSTAGPQQTISLPKGGGAMRGVGETFQADPFTGAGSFSVPIEVPGGRHGLQPELALGYSAGNGNGVFGLGWSLSIPGISRKTSKGVPRYDEARDVFILSGAEDLVPISGSFPGRVSYRPRTEGLFSVIERQLDGRNDFWEVRSKEGLTSLYGTPDQRGTDPAVVARGDDPSRVFGWRLTETYDTFGNRIVYEYRSDAGQGGGHRWNQPLLKRIRYADFEAQGRTDHLVSVSFLYDDDTYPGDLPARSARPDPFSEYRSGFEIRTARRCTGVLVQTHAGADRPVRAYRIVYLDERSDLPNLPAILPRNGGSLLSAIQVIGYDENGQPHEELPPLELAYSRFEPESRRDLVPVTGEELPALSLAREGFELVDLTGNGLPDLLERNGGVRSWRNLGNCRFDLPRSMGEAPAAAAMPAPAVQVMDADGDGRADLVMMAGEGHGYYPLGHDGTWDRRSFRPYRDAPSFSLADPEVRLVDLDGDGVTDAIRSMGRMECYFNDPREGWSGVRLVERRRIEDFPDVHFSDPRVKWADMSGDGLQDIVLVSDGNVEYWPNLGRGDWGARVHMHAGPRFPHGYDPRRILLGDVDGDGLADIVYVDHHRVTLWINRSGNGWADPVVIEGTPPVGEMDSVRLVDLRGSGTAGILWSADASSLGGQRLFFLDLTGRGKPYLLEEIDNQLGAVTRIRYAPSTDFYLADQIRGGHRWQTTLPFPVHVVAAVEVVDAISGTKLTTEYRYHEGYWDGGEREFRGFGIVDQLDSEVATQYNAVGLHGPGSSFEPVEPTRFSPPTMTRTWFHLGPVGPEEGAWREVEYEPRYWTGDPQHFRDRPALDALLASARVPRRSKRDAVRALRGRVLRTEEYALDGSPRQDRPYSVTETLHDVREVDPPANGDSNRSPIFFPHTLAQRTTQWERGDDPLTQITFTGDYDDHGQACRQTQVACPRGWRTPGDRPTEPYLATRTRTVYATPIAPRPYIRDRVASLTSSEIIDTGGRRAAELDALADDSPRMKVIGQTVHYYDGAAFQGLPFGRIGAYGALTRTESLVLDDAILQQAYGAGVPPYLTAGGAWTPEYPQAFRSSLPPSAGYIRRAAASGSPYAPGLFAASGRRRYDFQQSVAGKGRGLMLASLDALGNENVVEYDHPYEMLPVKVTDAAQLTTRTSYDYRVLQPSRVSDANGNVTEFGYSPLGLLEEVRTVGNPAKSEGDRQRASVRMSYDFRAFERSPPDARRPIRTRTVRQLHHDTEMDVPTPARDATLETHEFSDGFGRLVQTRTQGEEVTFGVDAIFGGGVLPTDPTDPASTLEVPARDARRAADPNVVVSGWQRYDNKGRVVEEWEPFYSTGWAYRSPQAESDQAGRLVLGQRIVTFHDARGRPVRTVNPNGSEHRVVPGVPGDLSQPSVYAPTPWETYVYDANDLAPLSLDPGDTPLAFRAPVQHHFTPGSKRMDALGRVVETVERNGSDPTRDWFHTRSAYDIRGNLLSVTDTIGREAFRYTYDLANRPLRATSIDGGDRALTIDAAGNRLEARDARGGIVLQSYDQLNRLTLVWGRERSSDVVSLRERLIHGDAPGAGLSAAAAGSLNLLGALYRHYDEAGLLTYGAYDFVGNVVEKTRRVIADGVIEAALGAAAGSWDSPPFRVDWQPPSGIALDAHAAGLLDPAEYRTTSAYDALNRVKQVRLPRDAANARQLLEPRYDSSGALESVQLDGEVHVERIAYNAKGQRTLIAYGNGVMTRYAYEPSTFLLSGLRTERYTRPAGVTYGYKPAGGILQDFSYAYDLAGNIVEILDRTPGSGVRQNPESAAEGDPGLRTMLASGDALRRRFTYDPLYRLISATGRECANVSAPRPWPRDYARCGFGGGTHATPSQDNAPSLSAFYREEYSYDAAGNLLTLRHTVHGGSPWTRHLGTGDMTPQHWDQAWRAHLNAGSWLGAPGNRLTHVGDDDPTVGATHSYDSSGNMTQETTSRHFVWDCSDRLTAFAVQAGPSAPRSLSAVYLYDAAGQRVKKLVRNQQGAVEVTVYIDDVFEHRLWKEAGQDRTNTRVHIMDGQARVCTRRVGDRYPADQAPAVLYQFGDHLGSSAIVADENGGWINREEYFPYGETSFGGFARKRYRFSGKERDEESGLCYYGARYYAPWLARWTSCDPLGMASGLNLYRAFASNPLRYVDPTGEQDEPTPAEAEAGQCLMDQGEVCQVEGDLTEAGADPGPAAAEQEISTLDIIWDTIKKLPEAVLKTREERAQAVAEVFEKQGHSPEEAAAMAEDYLGAAAQAAPFGKRRGRVPSRPGISSMSGGGGGGKPPKINPLDALRKKKPGDKPLEPEDLGNKRRTNAGAKEAPTIPSHGVHGVSAEELRKVAGKYRFFHFNLKTRKGGVDTSRADPGGARDRVTFQWNPQKERLDVVGGGNATEAEAALALKEYLKIVANLSKK